MSRTLLLLTVFLGALLVNGEIFFKNGAPHLQLSKSAGVTGHIRFSRDGRPFVSFEGIPFARVAERFAASELLTVPDWEGFKTVTGSGEMCVQPGMLGPNIVLGQEDCLLLSVQVPMGTGKDEYPKPVMVYLHGGGFTVGSGMHFGGSFFMDEDVIIVSINSRLGVFGFLSTGDEVIPGNNGLKDQVNALKWVKENIEKFGGDPNLVTIFGASGGSAATHYLKLSSTTKGLIHRVISQSGLAISPWAYDPNPKENAALIAKYLNCDSQNPEKIASEEISSCLKKVSKEKLVAAAGAFKQSWPPGNPGMIFVPVAEPEPSATSKNIPFITSSPTTLMEKKEGSNKDVPWLTGMTNEEGAVGGGSMIASSEPLAIEMEKNWNEIAPRALFYIERCLLPEDRPVVASKLKKFYFKGQPVSHETRKSLYHIYSDIFGNYPQKRAVEMAVAKGEQVYLYQYSYLAKISILEVFFRMPNVDKVVTHADDMLFQDDKPEIVPGLKVTNELSGEDVTFSKHFVRLFASFARHGKPTHTWGNDGNNIKWTPVSVEEATRKKPLKYYDIRANPRFIEEPFKERMDFLDSLQQYILREPTSSS